MNQDTIEQVKKLTIIAMVSDDELMERFVFKGGNAIEFIYRTLFRASWDLDYSIETEFKHNELEIIKEKIKSVLSEIFKIAGYEVFDVKFIEKPHKIRPDLADFWGGYKIEFKIIETSKYFQFNKIESLRRNASVVGAYNRRTFGIDISKFEYCEQKCEKEFEGYRIYVYSPEMIIIEKLRAICQQMPEYANIIKTSFQSARARDFYDIYHLIEKFQPNFESKKNHILLKKIFAAKRVPLQYLGKIKNYRDYHKADFSSVENTVKPNTILREFDFYFNYVIDKCEQLKSLWKE